MKTRIYQMTGNLKPFAAALAALLALTVGAHATDYYWDTTTEDDWSNGADWSTNSTGDGGTGTAPSSIADFAFFNGSNHYGNTTVRLNGNFSIGGLTFNNTNAGGTTIRADSGTTRTLTLGKAPGSAITSVAGNNTINVAVGAGPVTIGTAALPVNIVLNGSTNVATQQYWTNYSSYPVNIVGNIVNANNHTTFVNSWDGFFVRQGAFVVDLNGTTGSMYCNGNNASIIGNNAPGSSGIVETPQGTAETTGVSSALTIKNSIPFNGTNYSFTINYQGGSATFGIGQVSPNNTLTIDGGSVQMVGTFNVGTAGFGNNTLNIRNGAVFNANGRLGVGNKINNVVNVDGAGSTISGITRNNNGGLGVGGTWNITNGGTAILGANTMVLTSSFNATISGTDPTTGQPSVFSFLTGPTLTQSTNASAITCNSMGFYDVNGLTPTGNANQIKLNTGGGLAYRNQTGDAFAQPSWATGTLVQWSGSNQLYLSGATDTGSTAYTFTTTLGAKNYLGLVLQGNNTITRQVSFDNVNGGNLLFSAPVSTTVSDSFTGGMKTDTGSGTNQIPITVMGGTTALTVTGGIQGTGGLTLTSASNGTLKLMSDNNPYSGATIINGGTLKLAAANTNNIAYSPSINIASGAFLDVSGLSATTLALANGQTLMGKGTVSGGSVSVGVGAIVAPGDRTLVTPAKGTLTIQNALDLTGGTTNIRLFSSTANDSDKLVQNTAGTITFGGTLNLTQASNFTGTFAAGNSWDLFDWIGTPTGAFTLPLNLPALSGLTWDTSTLYTTGVISIAAGGGGSPTIGTITATPTAATIITGGSTGFGFTVVNTGTAQLNFATAAGTNTTGTVSGTTAVSASGTSSSVTGLSFNGTTVGLAQTGTFSVSDAAATPSSVNGTVTVNVLDHSSAALAVVGGDNQTIITGGSLATVTLDLTNIGSNRSPLDVSTLNNLSGTTGTAVVASNGTGAYTATGFDTVTVGLAKTLATSLSAGDQQSLSGANAMATKSANVTYDVYDHASAVFTPATLALGNIHANYSGPLGSSNNISVSNGTPGDNRVALKGAGTGTNNVSLTTITGLLNNGSATPLSASLASGIAGGTLLDQNITYTFADDSSLSGNSASLSTPSIAITGQVYSGDMIWRGTSGIAWGTDANWNDSSNASVHVAPGTDVGFTGVDIATFGATGTTGTVYLDSAAPSVNQLVFNTNGSYTLAQGSGSNVITLAGAGAKISSAGTLQQISAPLSLANNVEVAVSSGTLAVSGGINENSTGMTLLKSGGGILELSGSSNYSGLTTVDNGTLLVNSSIPGAVTVTSSVGTATLGGSGSITGAVNVTGILSPGGSVIESLASGALSLNSGSAFAYQESSSAAHTVGADLQKVVGNLDLSSVVTLTLSDIALTPAAFAAGTTFSLINYTGTWNGGLFTLGTTLANNSAFTAGLNKWIINYNAPDGGGNLASDYAGGLDSFVNITAAVANPGLDSDNDGVTNLAEFAFDGDPNDPTKRGLFFTTLKDNNADTLMELTYTCAVRRSTTIAFTASGNTQTATIDGVTYTIEGSLDLSNWNSAVTFIGKSDLPPAGSVGLPDLTATEWEYCTFSAFNGLGDKGFIRAKAVQP